MGNGIELRKLDAMINHNTCEVFIDSLEVPPDCLIGEEGRGFRYILDGMNAERMLIAHRIAWRRRLLPAPGGRVRQASASSSASRSARTRASQFPIARA